MATEVVVPMLGITVERGKIVEWLKKEGDSVEKGEIIFIVEVEKATTEVESPATGILAKILVGEGVEVPVLTVVGVITEPGEELPAKYLKPEVTAREKKIKAEAVSGPTPVAKAAPAPAPPGPGGTVKAIPAARNLARSKGIDLETLRGTGPGGTVLVRDVEAVLEAQSRPAQRVSTLAGRLAEKEGVSLEGVRGSGVRGRIMRADVEAVMKKEAAPGLGKVIPMSTMRKVISRRMSESAFTAPHIYFFTDVAMDPILDFRKEILPDFEKKYGLRPSINDFLIKAVAMNIVEFPIMNATVKEEAIHILPDVNICLAIALPDGLIVPAIANADKAGLVDITKQRKDLMDRALAGRLSIEELERGTFTISSLAQYEITYFTAILNPPQSGILTVGKTREQLTLQNGDVKVIKVATLGLGVDHRIIDGAVAADFLQNLKSKLERPMFTFLNL
ncbi:MAG: 2-oxo acid dehydrogenase subunit E2 [Deltaproteobacteria bacterium]|nr:2-oxo acid dehydrogenase subunit E2 [Deltaproteobacteria bacterium]